MDPLIISRLKQKAEASRDVQRALLTQLAMLPGALTETDEPDGYGRRRCISHDLTAATKNTLFLEQWVALAENL